MLVALLALSAAAAPFADDVESGSLVSIDGGPGAWDTLITFHPDVDITASPAAAHRGRFGMRIDDTHGDGGTGVEGWVAWQAPAWSQVFLRWWMRHGFTATGTLETSYLGFRLPDGGFATAGTGMRIPDGELQVGGLDRNKRDIITPADAGLTYGRWHLLELAVTGLGSADGGRLLWVDGALALRNIGLDYRTATLQVVSLGENFARPTATTRVLDYDDVRAGPEPHATWLSVTGPATATAGECFEVTVQLSDATGAAAPAPYPLDVSLAGATPCETLRVEEGAASGTGTAAVDTPGSHAIIARHEDLLSAGGFTVEAAWGAPRKLAVGCSCSASWAAPLASLALLRAARRRKGPDSKILASRRN